MLRVYDGREGEHTIFAVIDDGVDGGAANNRQIFSQMTIRFIDRHQFFCGVCLCLVQRDKLYVLGRLSLITK